MYERQRQWQTPSGARRATVRMPVQSATIQRRLMVGRSDDPSEREADAVAAEVVARLRDTGSHSTTIASSGNTRIRRASAAGDAVGGAALSADDERSVRAAGGSGGRLAGSVLERMGDAFGADFRGVRLHTGADVDIAAQGLQARAFTFGRDVFIRRREYRPGTASGDELIAHELTHTLQQRAAQPGAAQHGAAQPGAAQHGASKVRRSPVAEPVTIRHRVHGRRISTKKEKMHLDFIRMKRMDPQYSKIIGKLIGVDLGGAEQSGGTFGHWWTEVGDLDPITNEFDFDHSYGWWPSDLQGSLVNTVVGVDGQLNAGDTQDPHAGEDAPTEFHPVMEVDTAKESYDQIRQRVTQNLDTVAHAYRGKWHWRLGWGKNCHTFQQHLKTKTGIHYQKSKKWLYDPAAQALALQKQQARQADEERREAKRALATEWFNVAASSLTFMDPKTAIETQVESGGKLGPTGNETKDFMGMDCVEVVTWNGDVGWVLAMEFRGWTGQRGT